MNTIKLRWEVTKATEHDYWAINNILRIYIRYDVQGECMAWETCPINGGSRAKTGTTDTMPEAIAAAEGAALQMLIEDLEVVPQPEVALETYPNWQSDYGKLLDLVSAPSKDERDGWCLHGFHPSKGHCLIGADYRFDSTAKDGFSVVFKDSTTEFQQAQSLAKWCESERIWFLDPHSAYTMIQDSNE